MKIDTHLGTDLGTAAERARTLEAEGYDGLVSVETQHDPFLPLVLAAEHTERVELMTGIAVAFARNPMTLAHTGYDLHELSKGRFILGLGSQIRPHIEKRFSMTWSHPAPRMRELILAIRAIWESWNTGSKLDFRGDFYTHTLMTPFFNPGPNRYGTPRIFLAAVGEAMTEVAAEVADGVILHAFTNERYLREVTLPRSSAGWRRPAAAARTSSSTSPLRGHRHTDAEKETLRTMIRQQISFFALHPRRTAARSRSTAGATSRPSSTAVQGGQVGGDGGARRRLGARRLRRRGEPRRDPRTTAVRYGDIVDRVSFYTFAGGDGADGWTRIVAGLRRATAGSPR